jgi:hypothetical protein
MKHSPDVNMVWRCLKCQSFLLPKEIHLAKLPIKLRDGSKSWLVIELCPICFPNPRSFLDDPKLESSTFIYLTRDEYFTTRRYERSGLIPPDYGNRLIVS